LAQGQMDLSFVHTMETAAQPADLTERITRTSNYCTAVGGFGDIWQCLLQTDENQIVVRPLAPTIIIFLNLPR
jgi:hypothetical protein